jgi:hypothetical protein
MNLAFALLDIVLERRNMRRILPLSLALALAVGTAEARSIRVDLAIAPQFDNSGELWTQDNDVDLSGDGFVTGAIPFQLDFGGGAADYSFCFAENGFVSFFQSGGSCNSLIPPSGDYIAAFANDLAITESLWSIGSIDTGPAPFSLDDDVPAMRFTWRGTDSGGASLIAQLVLLDRGTGSFDIELNYGGPFDPDYVTSTLGGQGLSLGTNVVALTTGAFSGINTNYFFSMQSGVLSGGTTPPDPTPVDEPSALLLMLAALTLLLMLTRRRLRDVPHLIRKHLPARA